MIRVQVIDLAGADAAVLSAAQSNGFDAIELRTVADKDFTGEQLAAALQRTADVATGLQMTIASVTLADAVIHASDPSAKEHQRSILAAAIRSAGAINALLCILTPPPVTATATDRTPTSYNNALNATHRCLTQFQEEAEAVGVTLAVRAPYRGCLLSPVEVRELIDSVNAVSVGVCLDVRAIEFAGRLEDWLDTLRRRVVAVRLSPDTLSRYAKQIESTAADPCVAIVDDRANIASTPD